MGTIGLIIEFLLPGIGGRKILGIAPEIIKENIIPLTHLNSYFKIVQIRKQCINTNLTGVTNGSKLPSCWCSVVCTYLIRNPLSRNEKNIIGSERKTKKTKKKIKRIEMLLQSVLRYTKTQKYDKWIVKVNNCEI